MAKKACEYGAYAGSPGRFEADLRREAERVLYFTNADNVLLALGADIKRVGGGAYPIGRLVPTRRAGAGETRQQNVPEVADAMDIQPTHPIHGNAVRFVQADEHHPLDPLPPKEQTAPPFQQKPWIDSLQLEHPPAFLTQGDSQQVVDYSQEGEKALPDRSHDIDYDPAYAEWGEEWINYQPHGDFGVIPDVMAQNTHQPDQHVALP